MINMLLVKHLHLKPHITLQISLSIFDNAPVSNNPDINTAVRRQLFGGTFVFLIKSSDYVEEGIVRVTYELPQMLSPTAVANCHGSQYWGKRCRSDMQKYQLLPFFLCVG